MGREKWLKNLSAAALKNGGVTSFKTKADKINTVNTQKAQTKNTLTGGEDWLTITFKNDANIASQKMT